jgi:outer membrane beta-barrel protein
MKTAMRPTLAFAAITLLATSVARAQQRPAAPAQPAKSQVEEDIEKFWGKRRKVAVVQKRTFDRKEGRWEFSVHAGYIPNDPFVNYIPVGLRVAHHFREWIAMELGFLYTDATSFSSSLADGIRGVGQGTPFSLQLTLLEKWRAHFHLNATFSIIHGKVALMKTGLSHFDLFLTAGPSFHLVEEPVDSGGAPVTNCSAFPGCSFRIGGNAGIGMKFFINDFFGIRLDIRQYLFPKSSEAGGGLHKPTEISLGATFFAG